MKEIENAVIKSTILGIEDHGIFTFMINLDFSGSCQGYGGYILDRWVQAEKRRVGSAYGCDAILSVVTLFEKNWEELPGTPCRVESNDGIIYRLGHYITDRWVNLKELAEKYEEEK